MKGGDERAAERHTQAREGTVENGRRRTQFTIAFKNFQYDELVPSKGDVRMEMVLTESCVCVCGGKVDFFCIRFCWRGLGFCVSDIQPLSMFCPVYFRWVLVEWC